MSSPACAEDRIVAGRYRLSRVVGRGGMGVLWAAHDEMLGREVAVKELRAPIGADGEHDEVARERALREARAAARVTHPSAVTVYDVVEEDGRPWIVMELLPSRTLADVLAVAGSLAPPAVARIGLDLLDALTAAHEAGVVHRDVKPGNILLADGRAVLVDFGIAMVDGDGSLTSTGLLLGSPAFMAPERARGEKPTPASDLWSLGATLFTAVEGDAPFRRDGQLPTLAALVTQDAPPAEHAGPLRPLLAGLLARDPAERPSAAEARAQLVGALAANAELPTAALAVESDADAAFDDLEPTVEAAVIDDADLFPSPSAAAPVDAQRALRIPQPRRAGALAVALLAPVGLFALALGWPMGRANPILRPPQTVVTTAPATSAIHPASPNQARTPVRAAAASTRRHAQARTAQRVTSASASATPATRPPAAKHGEEQGTPHAKAHDKPGAGEKKNDKKQNDEKNHGKEKDDVKKAEKKGGGGKEGGGAEA